MIDGILAVAGLVLNAALDWWWADPAAGYVLVYYAAREVRDAPARGIVANAAYRPERAATLTGVPARPDLRTS
jgi:hypothetical protein